MATSPKRHSEDGLRPPYRSPFRIRRSWATLLLTSNVGAVVFGGITILAIIVLVISRSTEQDSSAIQAPQDQRIQIVDGDTFDLDGRRIRLHGIDAPEIGQLCSQNNKDYDCGKASKDYLSYLLSGEKLTCQKLSQDRWGRAVATCKAGNNDIGRMMVRHGWAVAHTEYSAEYVKDKEFARDNGLGLWAKAFALPKEWRKRQER